ncbi:adenylyl-sulfate kinase [Hwanghaeella grinnelliae]|uniref:Adenylyl-sulfate kinase n=1 Tax=Hwanghaeella grinnelliae TaxID=2500179 RepID=A0A437QJA7_9PROT|nr:bifunctional aminoglycoside phosphotransferase/ATP-binding protein [Hwanghaeella grinnelliae]RVU34584.1 adenylyl-sulfate kinase [Hwanghaeella grinnelliae]
MSSPVRENQEDAFACLYALATTGDAEAKRIDTHANVIFIGQDRVYKVKRAVYYPFLDYSTVALRYRYCASEVMLNRRTAPDLYLGIIPLIRTPDGSLASGDMIDDPDPVTPPQIHQQASDWAVVMRRFDENALFDKLAEREELTNDHLHDLGESIASFHAKTSPVRNDWDRINREVLTDNLAEIADAPWLPADAVADHRRQCEALFETLAPRLAQRAADGFIRQCHGDIHLRNIVLIDGRATLFDCIEFSDDFSQIDCLYDLAFLLMDLEHRAMPGAACRVLNRYLEETGDYAGIGLLPFYTALRAQVRAKIEIATVGFAETQEQADQHRREAMQYFNLACRAINRPPARLIAVGGPSGSGKSTLAMAVAERMSRHYGPAVMVLRSDGIRKSLFGVAETTKLPPEAYKTEVSKRVYRHMHEAAALALTQGAPVLLDATHTHPDSRQAASDLAASQSVPFQGLWATAPRDVLVDRVSARTQDASDADAAIVRMQLKQDWGVLDWAEIDTSKRSSGLDEQAASEAKAAEILNLA